MSLEKFLLELNAKKNPTTNSLEPFNGYNTTPHLFSNQFDYLSVFRRLENSNSLKIPGRNNMAALVGESCILSLAPFLAQHVNEVLFLDIDPKILQHNEFLIAAIRRTTNIAEFTAYVCSDANPMIKGNLAVNQVTAFKLDGSDKRSANFFVSLNADIYKAVLHAQSQLLGDQFFLYSELTFNRSKKAVEQLVFRSLCIDVGDSLTVKQLGFGLQEFNTSIVVLNVSNLYDYDSNYPLRERFRKTKMWQASGRLYESMVNLLDRPDETVILYGIMNPAKNYKSLTSCIATSLTEYCDKTSRYSTAINASCVYSVYTGKEVHLIPENTNSNSRSGNNYHELHFEVDYLKKIKMSFSNLLSDVRVTFYRYKPSSYFIIDAKITCSEMNLVVLYALFSIFKLPFRYKREQEGSCIYLYDINTKHQRMKLFHLFDWHGANNPPAFTRRINQV